MHLATNESSFQEVCVPPGLNSVHLVCSYPARLLLPRAPPTSDYLVLVTKVFIINQPFGFTHSLLNLEKNSKKSP